MIFRLIFSRLLTMAATLLIASVVIFTALQLVPGDPAIRIAGPEASDAVIEAIRAQLGLDRPAWQQYFTWLGAFVTGDFGQSVIYKQSAASLLAERAGTTLALDLMATCIVAVGGLSLGWLGAASRRLRPVVAALCGVLIGLPSFVAAALLIQVFVVQLGWFPAFGSSTDDFGGFIQNLLLPSFALSLTWMAFLGQITRSSLGEELQKEYVETARARGLTEARIFFRHVLRNGSIPIITVIGLTAAGLIAGSIVVEHAFALDGLGAFLVSSVLSRDTPVVLAICMLVVAAFIIITTLADVAHRALDPRIRAHG